MILIGLFLLVYGLWYQLKEDAWTYLGITGTIYLSSISTLLIACCYWKRANNWGAAGAIVVGAVIPIAGLVSVHWWDVPPDQAQFWMWYAGIGAFVATWVAMIGGSLLKSLFELRESPEAAVELPATAGGES